MTIEIHSDRSEENGAPGVAASRWDSLPEYSGTCLTYEFRVPTARIGFVNAILESFDNMGRIRTKEIRAGIMEVLVPGDMEEVFQGAMEELKKRVMVENLRQYGSAK